MHVGSARPTYAPCYGSWFASNLRNGVNYIFSVIATDAVENVGSVVSYTWRIGKLYNNVEVLFKLVILIVFPIDAIPPAIDNLPNVTVHCGEDYLPSAVGRPTVTDNEDLNPTLTYTDVAYQDCTFTRVWNATDSAGNTILANQSIRFSDILPPVVLSPSLLPVACGSVAQHNNLSVSHPCNRPLSLTYTDSVDLYRCAFTFTRTWTVADDCGMSVTFRQDIRVLNQQFPDHPMNGLINARLDETLIWPHFPGVMSYEVYIWEEAEVQPSLPVTVTNQRSYYPHTNYPPGTRMLWQIVYVLGVNDTVPSPIWGFETEHRPDLRVIDVTVPAYAFSGQTFDVRWTVTNNGGLSVTIPSFTDAIYLSRTSSFSDSRMVRVVTQRRFLDPNDGYSSEASINIQDNDIGIFYVFAFTDRYNAVS